MKRLPRVPQDKHSRVRSTYSLADRGQDSLAKTLTELLFADENPLTVCLYASRGTGKSFFLEQWQQWAKDNGGHKIIIYDAWKYDHHADPLLSIIQEVTQHFDDPENLKKFQSKLREYSWEVVKNLSAMAAGTINPGFAALLLAATQGGKPNATQDIFADFKNLEQAIRDFSMALSAYAEKIGGLVIVVDELDRCRPDFALQVLERIKHYMNIPGVKFLISCDMEQLFISIKHTYGADTQSDEYLRRFFDYRFGLPSKLTQKLVEAKLKAADLGNSDGLDIPKTAETILSLCESFNLKFRDIEQLTQLLYLAVNAAKVNFEGATTGIWPLVYFCILKLIEPNVLAKIVREKTEAFSVIENDLPKPYRVSHINHQVAILAGLASNYAEVNGRYGAGDERHRILAKLEPFPHLWGYLPRVYRAIQYCEVEKEPA